MAEDPTLAARPGTLRSLLVLGSKPDPTIPPRASITDVACANGSAFSAARHGLPAPIYTVMTALLTSGEPSGRLSLQALRGLHTKTVHFLPRPPIEGSLLRRLRKLPRTLRMSEPWFRHCLHRAGYSFDHFQSRPHDAWISLVLDLCDHDPDITSHIHRKHPSTGVLAIALGLSDPTYTHIIVSGFSFELTHAYGRNPEIDRRGTAHSKHADTDVAILRHLALMAPRLTTSEPLVAERTGIPPFDPAAWG